MANDGSSQLLLEEYRECCASARHYSNIRFASLTVFSALAGGCMTIIQNDDALLWPKVIAANIGIAITIVFIVIEAGVNKHINLFQDRASAIEPILQFDSWSQLANARKSETFHRIMLFLMLTVFLVFIFSVVMLVLITGE